MLVAEGYGSFELISEQFFHKWQANITNGSFFPTKFPSFVASNHIPLFPFLIYGGAYDDDHVWLFWHDLLNSRFSYKKIKKKSSKITKILLCVLTTTLQT